MITDFRFLSRLLYAVACYVKERKSPRLTWNRQGFFTLAAALSHVLYNVSYYTSGNYLALGAVGSLYQFSSMFFGAVLSFAFGLENFRFAKFVAIVMCSIGTLLILQPYPLFDHGYHPLDHINLDARSAAKINSITNTSHMTNMHNVTIAREPLNHGTNFYFGIGLSIAAGVFASIQFVIQKLEFKEGSGNLVIFWVSALGIPLSIIIALTTESLTMVTSWNEILIFLLHCLANVFTVAVFYAPTFTNITVITTTLSMVTVFMYIAQRTVLSHILPGTGNLLEILGILVTTVGSMILPLYEGLKVKGQH